MYIDSYIANKNVCKNNIVHIDLYFANKNVCKIYIVHNDTSIANKKSNKIAFFVIHDTILSLTLKGKSLSIKIMEVDVQSILFQLPCNIFITGPSACGKPEFVHKLIDYRRLVQHCS